VVNSRKVVRSDEGEEVDHSCELIEFQNLDILHGVCYENLVSNESKVETFKQAARESVGLTLARYKLPGTPFLWYNSNPGCGIAETLSSTTSPDAGDLPRSDPAYALKPYRCVYGARGFGKASFLEGIVKTNTETETSWSWEEEKHTPAEPIFVPGPDGKEEAEGVVLLVVLNVELGTGVYVHLTVPSLQCIQKLRICLSFISSRQARIIRASA